MKHQDVTCVITVSHECAISIMLHKEQHIKTYFNEYFILTSSVNIITVFIHGWLPWLSW